MLFVVSKIDFLGIFSVIFPVFLEKWVRMTHGLAKMVH